MFASQQREPVFSLSEENGPSLSSLWGSVRRNAEQVSHRRYDTVTGMGQVG